MWIELGGKNVPLESLIFMLLHVFESVHVKNII